MLIKTIERLFLISISLSIQALCQFHSFSGTPSSRTLGSSMVAIAHSTHRLVAKSQDIGPVEANLLMKRMVLVLGPGVNHDEGQLGTFLDSQQEKASPNYHQWLTPEEFGEKFGPSTEELQQARRWLEEQGFQITSVAKSRRWMEFSGTAQQVEKAFATKMRRFELGGKPHIANSQDISIPFALVPIVRGVLSLHDFRHKPMVSQHYRVERNANGVLEPADPAFTVSTTSGTRHFLAPSDFARIYNLSALYQDGIDGTGQTIAIVARSNVEMSDVETFRQIFNLPANDPNVIFNGPIEGAVGDEGEASLDVQWAGAVAPNAAIDLVISASTVTTDGVDLSASYIVDNNLAPVMSVSFGACEQQIGAANAFYSALWQQAAAQGISVFVSAGDNGPAGCDDPNDFNNVPASSVAGVNGLASTPFNTAVGGTQFNENGNDSTFWNTSNGPQDFGSSLGYIPEVVWNESCDPRVSTSCSDGRFSLFAGSGGVSTLYSKPGWQAAPGVPGDGKRDLPDISLAAAGGHDGYLTCVFGSCQTRTDFNGQPQLRSASVFGGTSASAPAFAAIMALVNQKTASRQGLANYILYRLAANQDASACNSTNQTNPSVLSQCIFYDTTAGNNSIPGQTGANATAGYDLATGLGSVNAANLVNSWGSATFQGSSTTLSASPVSIAHGDAVAVTITTRAASGMAAPTGNVALVSDKYGSIGAGILTNGTFTGSFRSLPGGQYNLVAHYGGDGTFGASDSSALPVTVTPESSSTSLTAYTYDVSGPTVIPPSLPYGQFIYFHSEVKGASSQGSATGTITYRDGTNILGTLALNTKGEAELISGGFGANVCLPIGTHTITASYSGDNSFNASSGQPWTITIRKVDSILSVDANPLTVTSTQQVLLHTYVINRGPILPTGTVQFFDNGVAIGGPMSIAPPAEGQTPQAVLQTALTVGSHIITLSYSGDDVYKPGTFAPSTDPLKVTVTSATGVSTRTTLTAPVSTTALGSVVTYTVSVAALTPSSVPLAGTVQIYNSPLGALGQPATLVNGSATIPIQWGFAGAETVTAQYSGDSTYAASGSDPVTVNVTKITPAINVTSNRQSVPSGTQVSFTATLQPGIQPQPGFGIILPNGKIQFYDSLNGSPAQPIGSAHDLTLGNGSLTTLFTFPVVLPDGSNSVYAQYLGDPGYNPVTSSAITVTVGQPSFQITVNRGSNISVTAGQSASASLMLTSIAGFTGTATLACSGAAPAGTSCSFSPPAVTISGSPSSAVVNIATLAPTPVGQSAALHNNILRNWSVGFALVGCFLLSPIGKRLQHRAVMIVALISFLLLNASCGGGGGKSSFQPTPPPTTSPSGSPTSTMLTSSNSKIGKGNAIGLTALVSSSKALTGNVTFFDEGVSIGQGAVTNGRAQLQTNSLSVGTHSITAQYGGDSQNASSTSGIFRITITGTATLEVSATAAGQTQKTTFNVIVQ